jgi:hypothetical protein
MYEYKFVKFHGNVFASDYKDDHQRVIQEHASDGWRLVTIFVPHLPAMPHHFELIFERPKS